MRLGQDDTGASSALAFIVAGIMFLAAVTVLIVTANDKVPPESQQNDRGSQQEADALLALLTESPGLGWNDASKNWTMAGVPGDYYHTGYRPSLVGPGGALDEAKVNTWRDGCLGPASEPASNPDTCISSEPSPPNVHHDEGGYLIARRLLGLEPSPNRIFDFNVTLRDISPAGPGFGELDFHVGPPPPQTTGQVAGAAASARLVWDDDSAPTMTGRHTYEITVFVFRTCDPTIPCDP